MDQLRSAVLQCQHIPDILKHILQHPHRVRVKVQQRRIRQAQRIHLQAQHTFPHDKRRRIGPVQTIHAIDPDRTVLSPERGQVKFRLVQRLFRGHALHFPIKRVAPEKVAKGLRKWAVEAAVFDEALGDEFEFVEDGAVFVGAWHVETGVANVLIRREELVQVADRTGQLFRQQWFVFALFAFLNQI